MSDYRFGDEYKLNIFPKEAIGYGGELDMDKVESVEIDYVDFVRKSEDKSRWHELFGTPERAARTIMGKQLTYDLLDQCDECPHQTDECFEPSGKCTMDNYDALLEWLRGDA